MNDCVGVYECSLCSEMYEDYVCKDGIAAIPPAGIIKDHIFICDKCINDYYLSDNSIINFLEAYRKKNDDFINKLYDCIKYYIPQLFKLSRKQIPQKIRDKIFKKYDYKCIKCGADNNLEIDHIKAYSNGGGENENNLQVLCKTCNLKKGIK